MEKPLSAEEVRTVIREQIERREKRIRELRLEMRQDITTPNRLVELAILIDKIDHGICTLIELEHILRLCDCPDEVYKEKQP